MATTPTKVSSLKVYEAGYCETASGWTQKPHNAKIMSQIMLYVAHTCHAAEADTRREEMGATATASTHWGRSHKIHHLANETKEFI